MISEQFYNLQYERILVPYRKQVLEELNKMVTGKEPRHFYTVYLTIFMLLYETEVTCADRHRRAVQYSEPVSLYPREFTGLFQGARPPTATS